jgi:hypothetical protein
MKNKDFHKDVIYILTCALACAYIGWSIKPIKSMAYELKRLPSYGAVEVKGEKVTQSD